VRDYKQFNHSHLDTSHAVYTKGNGYAAYVD